MMISGSHFMERNSHRELGVCVFAGAHLRKYVCSRGGSLGLYEFLCAWMCVLCVVTCVYPQGCGRYSFVHYASCVSVCVFMFAHKYMHIEGSLKRENSGQAFRLTLFNYSMRCQYPPKVSTGLSSLPSLVPFSFQSPHVWAPDEGQARCLALLALTTAL